MQQTRALPVVYFRHDRLNWGQPRYVPERGTGSDTAEGGSASCQVREPTRTNITSRTRDPEPGRRVLVADVEEQHHGHHRRHRPRSRP